MKIYSFPSIVTKDSKVLVLGTMPGKMSLQLKQYYGHGGNHFWRIIYDLFEEDLATDYESRVEFANRKRIAIWDVLQACERESSADSDIVMDEPNDFKAFFEKYDNIEVIFFNGKKAKEYFDEYYPQNELPVYVLPSTSPANTWFTYSGKLQEWNRLLKWLT